MIATIQPAPWSDQAAAMLATTIRGTPCYTVDDMRAEIARGDATLYSVTVDGDAIAYVVLRIELYQGGAEGVIVAAAGELMGAKLYGQVLPALERLFMGVKTIRIESCRRGATRELLAAGYLPTSAVFRKVVRPELAPDDRLEALQACSAETIGGPDLRARPGKLHMGGGGGSSSSSSSQTTNNTDRRIVADSGAIGISSDTSTVSINTLDAGAIDKAFEFAKFSDQETGKTLNQVLGVAAAVFDKAGRTVDSSAALVSSAYDNAKGAGAEQKALIGAALAVVAIVAIQVLRK